MYSFLFNGEIVMNTFKKIIIITFICIIGKILYNIFPYFLIGYITGLIAMKIVLVD